MPKPIRAILAFVIALLFCVAGSTPKCSSAAETKTGWQAEWDKTVKAAEDEGALALYITGTFEPVFREAFQKKFPKIKVTTVTGRGPELSQRVMSERRAEKYAVDLYVSGNISPLTVFHRAKILLPVQPLLLLPDVVDLSAWYEGKHHHFQQQNSQSSRDQILLGFVEPQMETQDRFRRSVPVRTDQRGADDFFTSTPSSGRSLSGGCTATPISRSCAPTSKCWIGWARVNMLLALVHETSTTPWCRVYRSVNFYRARSKKGLR